MFHRLRNADLPTAYQRKHTMTRSNNRPSTATPTRHLPTSLEALRSKNTELELVTETPAAKIAQHAADKKDELDAIMGKPLY